MSQLLFYLMIISETWAGMIFCSVPISGYVDTSRTSVLAPNMEHENGRDEQ